MRQISIVAPGESSSRITGTRAAASRPRKLPGVPDPQPEGERRQAGEEGDLEAPAERDRGDLEDEEQPRRRDDGDLEGPERLVAPVGNGCGSGRPHGRGQGGLTSSPSSG